MKKIIAIMMLGIFLFSLASALDEHERNTEYDLLISSNNATSCDLTYLRYPNNSINNLSMSMNRDERDFTILVGKSNFTDLGNTYMHVTCFDGSGYSTGSKGVLVTPSGRSDNVGFFIILIVIIYGTALTGFLTKNEIITLFGALSMFWIGIYFVTQGIVIYQDWLTNAIGYLSIGLGAYLSFIAGQSLYQDL